LFLLFFLLSYQRKLCVAIALIGDPEVVLLDEPSAGLDPVSRRNLWNVIMKTMANRAVVYVVRLINT
jgi:ABC-type multidrug transport system ATPase subunit